MQKEFTVGSAVKVPCHIQPGAFQNEYLVIIDTGYGPISGFIKRDLIDVQGNDKGSIFGRIIGRSDDSLTVQLPGSFFTTATGQASISGDWASQNLKLVNAA